MSAMPELFQLLDELPIGGGMIEHAKSCLTEIESDGSDCSPEAHDIWEPHVALLLWYSGDIRRKLLTPTQAEHFINVIKSARAKWRELHSRGTMGPDLAEVMFNSVQVPF